MLDVFFYEAFEEEAEALRRFLPAGIRAGFTAHTIQEERHVHPPADIISIRTQSAIPGHWATALKGVLSRSTGFDHIQRYRWETGHSVHAGYLPLYCHRSVAEQAMLLWMALLRRLPQQMDQFNRFHRDGITGCEAAGRTLMVAGVGNIGYEVCRIGRGLDMEVIGVDIDERHRDVYYLGPDEAIGRADVIVCSMSLNHGNRHYFNSTRFQQAKRGAVFVNIARGELSPAIDLVEALDMGVLSGVALDVYEEEKELAVSLREGGSAASDSARWTMELAKRQNVILTPHNAFNTTESVQRKSRQSVEQVEHFLLHGAFLWPVPSQHGPG
ncbi:D-isomer specific 2-hydroxyacid dehydrogenase NAD-binding protein [Desulfurispirillum indicum S5]|uniref:D-isomer specific 2-hydroxyacid dehydrogenase NAD-binding protein n=1 Tax=Desulfurispirillum indicum (strain ATCC BAA-1389 / DSM 22839 / S5) TaxID=653733 RepID=E6W1Q0_DESIS|nr:NAD(P)-dependent oxidoreductase [Desulfurispirillum indicum]ADU66599.1 D-isomer specific 2-hydroxyacid dehydrogenase NAD-binding protein [Desulfurispirillum indicum S5]